jgi:ABC-type phosphate transport system auxiliary subunit
MDIAEEYYNQAIYANDMKDRQIKHLESEIERLREALQLMVNEKCDYMILNKLGDPEKQHTIKLARSALQQKEKE